MQMRGRDLVVAMSRKDYQHNTAMTVLEFARLSVFLALREQESEASPSIFQICDQAYAAARYNPREELPGKGNRALVSGGHCASPGPRQTYREIAPMPICILYACMKTRGNFMLMRPKSLFLAACLLAAPAFADSSANPSAKPEQQGDLFSMDLESLLTLKVTTASKFSEKLSDAPGVMEVVTKDELRRFGGMTLAEILDRVPGLSVSTASFTDRSIIAARGDQTKINSGHILFLINGRPSREILEGGISSDLLESFPVSILEKIEVILGPGSVLYGSNAFSAVVNLITQKAEGTNISVTGLGGGGAAVAPSGQFSIQRGGLSIVGAGQYHQEPSWTTPVSTAYFGIQNPTIPNRGKGAYVELDYKGLRFMSSYTEWNSFYIEGGVGDARWQRGFADLGYSF
jgi:outer membrane receptor protein involved in Fe transport